MAGATVPASPFAALLRKSRFASFDPAIRQTYTTPPAGAHRGAWGLKRPLALRKRNAFITLDAFEDHAHYVPWESAEDQVRFVRRVEEMNRTPWLESRSAWTQGLGEARTVWQIDSEFAPANEEGNIPKDTSNGQLPGSDIPPIRVDLAGLGENGPGTYGSRRGTGAVMPNLESMRPREFARYLRRLRTMRPAFKEYLAQKELQKKNSTDNLTETEKDGKALYSLAQNTATTWHRNFIAQQTRKEFSNSAESQPSRHVRIAPHPHPNGGLLYSHPSQLDSFFHTRPQPGIILHQSSSSPGSFSYRSHKNNRDSFIASFGGLTANLDRSHVGGAQPAFDFSSQKGIHPNAERGFVKMRLIPQTRNAFTLEETPKVVGRAPPIRNGSGTVVGTGPGGRKELDGTRVSLSVRVETSETKRGMENPYYPGSRAYVAAQASLRRGMMPLAKVPIRKTITGGGGGKRSPLDEMGIIAQNRVNQQNILATLQNLGRRSAQNDQSGRKEKKEDRDKKP